MSTSVALYPTLVCLFVSLSDLPLGVLPHFLSPRLLCPKTLDSSVFQLLLLLKQAIWDYLGFAPACFVLEMGRIEISRNYASRFQMSRQLEETLTQTRFDKSSGFCSYVMTCPGFVACPGRGRYKETRFTLSSPSLARPCRQFSF